MGEGKVTELLKTSQLSILFFNSFYSSIYNHLFTLVYPSATSTQKHVNLLSAHCLHMPPWIWHMMLFTHIYNILWLEEQTTTALFKHYLWLESITLASRELSHTSSLAWSGMPSWHILGLTHNPSCNYGAPHWLAFLSTTAPTRSWSRREVCGLAPHQIPGSLWQQGQPAARQAVGPSLRNQPGHAVSTACTDIW